MKPPLFLSCLALAALVACDGAGDAPSKEDVRAMQEESDHAGKADSFDLCTSFGFYGDGVCDAWCPAPDDADCSRDQLYLTVSGWMRDFASGEPLAGGQVCSSDACATIAADGAYALEIRKHRLVEVTTSKDGYVPAMVTFRTGDDSFVFSNQLVTEATYALLAATFFGAEVDPGQGVLVTNAYRWVDGVFPHPNDAEAELEPLPGVSYELERLGGEPGAVQTLYFGTSGLPDPALTETSAAGLSVSGPLAPGVYRVVAHVPEGMDCWPRFLPEAWGPEVDAFVRVRPGVFTGLWTQCVEAP